MNLATRAARSPATTRAWTQIRLMSDTTSTLKIPASRSDCSLSYARKMYHSYRTHELTAAQTCKVFLVQPTYFNEIHSDSLAFLNNPVELSTGIYFLRFSGAMFSMVILDASAYPGIRCKCVAMIHSS